MKRKLLLAALCVVGAWGSHANADDVYKDVTSTYLDNADFEGGYKIARSLNSGDRAIYTPDNWTEESYENGNKYDMSALGSECLQWDNTFKNKVVALSGGGNHTYWIRFNSGQNQRLTIRQSTKTSLPKGTYRISADWYVSVTDKGAGYIIVNNSTTGDRTDNSTAGWSQFSKSYTTSGATFTITFGAFHSAKDSEKLYAFDNFKIEWNLTQSLTDLLSEANTFYSTEGDSYTALKTVIDATNTSSTDADDLEEQYNALSAALDLAKNHRKPWLTAKTAALTAINNTTDYGNVTGEEKTNLQSAIDADEPSDADGYDSATTNLETQTNAFTTAKADYDALVAEIDKSKALGIDDVTADGYAATSSSTAESVRSNTQALKVAEYNYVAGNYTNSLILESWSESTVKNENKSEHWDDVTTSYKASNGWDSNSWTASFSQSLELPAGNYVFKVAGRRSNSSAMWMEVKNGETTLGSVNDFPKATSGLGINTSGETDFTTGEGHNYANNGNGRGWEWRYVKFTLEEKATVTVAIKGSAGVSNQYINFTNYEVLTDEALNVSLYEYYKAYNSATIARDETTYTNVDGKEKADLLAAIAADASLDKNSTTDVDAATTALKDATTAFTTEDAVKNYKDLADAISTAQNLVAADTNVGSGVFQIPVSAQTTLSNAATEASDIKSNVATTAADAASAAETLNAAIETYNNASLNAPDADKRYYLNIVDAGQTWDGYAVTFIAGGRSDMGNYAVKYLAPANPNQNQALKFTVVDGEVNTYKVSAIRVENGSEQYLTTGSIYSGGNNTQIRTTDDASKALLVKIRATSTEGQFQLLNVLDGNKVIARNASYPDNGMYTQGNASFTLAEASQAEVSVSVAAGKYATRIFPFTPTLPEGVVAYSCEYVDGENLTLATVDEPVANVPYILYSENGVETTNLTGWGTAATDSYKVGLLTGVYTNAAVPEGSYVLQTQEGKQGFYQVAEGDNFEAIPYRAYLTWSGTLANVRALFFPAAGEATGIEAIGVLTSGNYDAIYTAGGAKVNSLQKGLNVVVKDGKSYKIFVK